MQNLRESLSIANIEDLSLPSNFKYGQAVYRRGAVQIIQSDPLLVEAWVGGLDGTVAEGAGSRRRVQLYVAQSRLAWHCAGNPKNHQIFCKHCVALALAVIGQD